MSDLNRRYGLHHNFLKPDGTPKTMYRPKPKKEYTLEYHLDKIKNEKVKGKFFEIRDKIRTLYPDIIEEYSKKRVTYRRPDRFNLYALLFHRNNIRLWIKDENGPDYLRIGSKTDIGRILKAQ